jgi:hypothetical protein
MPLVTLSHYAFSPFRRSMVTPTAESRAPTAVPRLSVSCHRGVDMLAWYEIPQRVKVLQ